MIRIFRRGPGQAAALAVIATLAAGPAWAVPARIILLRHGEKLNAWQLCPVGLERAQALATRYLGKGAEASLFAAGEAPAAFLAISLHTLELITPAATSWGMPVVTYSVLPAGTPAQFQAALDLQTRQAAHDVLNDPRWDGATLVMAWEHDHIAKTDLDLRADGGKDKHGAARPTQAVTLYDLLGLDRLREVPRNWPGDTYDYFWIITFDPATRAPATFRMQKQSFTGPFADLPQNDWGAPDGLTAASGCMLSH